MSRIVHHESRGRGLTHWYAIMTKRLRCLLSRYGFEFQPIGGPVDFHGIRTPYLAEIERIEKKIRGEKTGLYKEFTKGLAV